MKDLTQALPQIQPRTSLFSAPSALSANSALNSFFFFSSSFDFPPTPPLLFLHANHQPSMAPRQPPHRPHHSRHPKTHRIPHPLHLRRPSPRPRKISLHRPHHARLDDRFPPIHASRPNRRSHARPRPRRNHRIPPSQFQKG